MNWQSPWVDWPVLQAMLQNINRNMHTASFCNIAGEKEHL
jgi:hypothetical protein